MVLVIMDYILYIIKYKILSYIYVYEYITLILVVKSSYIILNDDNNSSVYYFRIMY